MATLNAAHATPGDSPLKTAFQQSRATGNIEVVLPVLRSARLFIVSGSPETPGSIDYFLTPSPAKNGRMCVTVSESLECFANISWPKVPVTGEQLLLTLPANMEIVVVYRDGGDYITKEQLDWYRGLLEKV